MTNDSYRSRLLKLHREEKHVYRWYVIADLVKKFSCKVIAEIGICEGHTAAEILHKNELLAYYMVDPWIWKNFSDLGFTGETAYQQIVKEFTEPCIKIMRMASLEASKLIPDNSLDFVFIDAAHEYKHICQDMSLWWPKVRKGGILSGHDYEHPKHPEYGVKKAVDERFALDQVHFEDDLVFWIKK